VRLHQGTAALNSLCSKYSSVFQEGMGAMHQFQATLRVKAGTKPVFHRPRPTPFSIRDAIGKKLNQLEQEGVIEKVETNKWAAPFVAVPKKDDRIRVCGDFKVTINPHLDVEQYPLPKPDDLFASLAGSQKFTKLDLTHAYQKMVLKEEARQYLTVNTHQGLYRYCRLPFGVSSAPAMFQRAIRSRRGRASKELRRNFEAATVPRNLTEKKQMLFPPGFC